MGTVKIDCECGCGSYGSPRPRSRDGSQHTKRCECKRCIAGQYKGLAQKRERKIAKAIGGKANVGSGSLGGVDTIEGVCDVEETSQVAITRGFQRWWLGAMVTHKTMALMRRRLRPRALVLSWGDKVVSPQVVIMPYNDWVELCQQAQEKVRI